MIASGRVSNQVVDPIRKHATVTPPVLRPTRPNTFPAVLLSFTHSSSNPTVDISSDIPSANCETPDIVTTPTRRDTPVAWAQWQNILERVESSRRVSTPCRPRGETLGPSRRYSKVLERLGEYTPLFTHPTELEQVEKYDLS